MYLCIRMDRLRPRTSLAKDSTQKITCSSGCDRVSSRSLPCPLCEADLWRQIRFDSGSDTPHATDMPAHLLSSARRSKCGDADSTHPATQPSRVAFSEFRFRESGPAESSRRHRDEVADSPPFPLVAIKSSGRGRLPKAIFLSLSHLSSGFSPTGTWASC